MIMWAMVLVRMLGWAALFLATCPIWAQPPVNLLLVDGTPVALQLDQTISSAHARVGDPLSFVVVRDVTAQGYTVIPAGSWASGTLVRVHGRRILGMGGNLVLKLNSVELANGDHVALRARKEVKGTSHTWRMAAGMAITSIFYMPAAPVFLLTRGDNCTALKSMEIIAQVSGDTSLASTDFPAAVATDSGLNQAIQFLPPRVVNGEGRQGDMVNLIFIGHKDELQAAFGRAGWIKPEHWKLRSAWHVVTQRNHYIRQPMSRFFLFGRSQDYAFAKPDPAAIVSRRHHIRIWKTGREVDGTPIWAAAATHDVGIEFAKRGRLFNHRIDPNVDSERDFIGANLSETPAVRSPKLCEWRGPRVQSENCLWSGILFRQPDPGRGPSDHGSHRSRDSKHRSGGAPNSHQPGIHHALIPEGVVKRIKRDALRRRYCGTSARRAGSSQSRLASPSGTPSGTAPSRAACPQ